VTEKHSLDVEGWDAFMAQFGFYQIQGGGELAALLLALIMKASKTGQFEN